jgi:hypothetical protein
VPIVATEVVAGATVRIATTQRVIEEVARITSTRTILAPLQIITPPALIIAETRTLPRIVETRRPPPVVLTRLATAFRNVQQLRTLTLPAVPTTVRVVVPQPFTLLRFAQVLAKPMTAADCSKEILRDVEGIYRPFCASRVAGLLGRSLELDDGRERSNATLGELRAGPRRRALLPDRLLFCNLAAISDACGSLLNGGATPTPTQTSTPAATPTVRVLRKADTTCGNGGITWYHHALEQPRLDLWGDPNWLKFDPLLYDPVTHAANARYYDTGTISSLGYWSSRTTTAPAANQDFCSIYYDTHKAYNVQTITQRGYMFAPLTGTYTFTIYDVSPK